MRSLGVILFLSCGLCALGDALTAVPTTCGTASLAVYTAQGFSCTIGAQPTFTFSDFSFSVLGSSGSPTVLGPGNIQVNPGNPQLDALSLQFSSSGFSVTAGQEVSYAISYTIDPPPPEIIHFGLSLGSDPPPPFGLAQITSDLCVGAAFSFGDNGTSCPSGITDNLAVYQRGSTVVPSAIVQFPAPGITTLGVIDTITLNGESDAYATISGFGNNTVTDVPEPFTGLPVAIGLVLVLFLTRSACAKLR